MEVKTTPWMYRLRELEVIQDRRYWVGDEVELNEESALEAPPDHENQTCLVPTLSIQPNVGDRRAQGGWLFLRSA